MDDKAKIIEKIIIALADQDTEFCDFILRMIYSLRVVPSKKDKEKESI